MTTNKKTKTRGKVSLPVKFEDALRALLQTKPPPSAKKRAGRPGKRKKA